MYRSIISMLDTECMPLQTRTKSPYCILCTDDEELKKNYPCQKCNEDYFLTKENKCVFCKSEQYGGKGCKTCGYINIDGVEKIGCIKCDSDISGYLMLTKEGKCFNKYKNELNCMIFEHYLNKNLEKKYGCVQCQEGYYLDEEHKCIYNDIENCLTMKIFKNKKICLSCKNGYKLVDNNCEKLLEPIIEGCSILNHYSSEENSAFCQFCDSSYQESHGFCFKNPDNPLVKNCVYFDFNNGFLNCGTCRDYKDFYFNNHYLNSVLMCGNEYFGFCEELSNDRIEMSPKYYCKKCGFSFIKVTDENGMIQCLDQETFGDIRCLEGKIDTYYYKDIFTCTKCHPLYILSYSEFYEKNICKYIYEDEKVQIEDNVQNLQNEEIPGCKTKVIKPKSENQVQCEECTDNYFQISPGKCELCNKVLNGCEKCSYIDNDEIPTFIPIRKRKLICNKCQEGYILKENNCIIIDNLIPNCNKIETKNENEFQCSEAKSGYYVDNGKVEKCEINCNECSLINENGNKIIKCTSADYGYFINKEGKVKNCRDIDEGISNCFSCFTNQNFELFCDYCITDYIKVGKECKPISELYPVEGCSYYLKKIINIFVVFAKKITF